MTTINIITIHRSKYGNSHAFEPEIHTKEHKRLNGCAGTCRPVSFQAFQEGACDKLL